jgi:serine/threonine-protein kinase RsbW
VVEIVLTSDLSALERLAETVAAFGREHRLPERLMQQMTLALDELFTNVITHGYGAERGTIVLRLGLADGWLEAELVDTAAPFDPLAAAPPDLGAPLEERAPGGLGVHLVRTLVDRVVYEREGARNHVRLRKRIGGPAETA